MSHWPYLGPTYTRKFYGSWTPQLIMNKNNHHLHLLVQFFFISVQSTSDIVRFSFQSSVQYQNVLRRLESCFPMYSIDIFALFC